jgi:hypothetical protein
MTGNKASVRPATAAVILLSPRNGEDWVAAHRDAPVLFPVAIGHEHHEVAPVARLIHEQLGIEVFLRQIITSPRPTATSRVFVAELLGTAPPAQSWLPAAECRGALAKLLQESLDCPDGDPLILNIVEGLLRDQGLPWRTGGWLSALQERLDDHFGEPTEVRPFKLRLGRIILRAANKYGLFEVHSSRTPGPGAWRASILDNGPLAAVTRAYRPRHCARWPDLGAELYVAPMGTLLSVSGRLDDWDEAMRLLARMQAESQEAVVDSWPAIELVSDIEARLDRCSQEWQQHEGIAQALGPGCLDWIRENVSRAARTLAESGLPNVLSNGAASSYTLHLLDGRLHVSEWEPVFAGHPFTSLASLLLLRRDGLAGHSAARLARPFVAAWLPNEVASRASQLARAGIVVGSAVQAVAVWEMARDFLAAATPGPRELITAWAEIIMRGS